MRWVLMFVGVALIVSAGAAYAWLSSDRVRVLLESQAGAALGVPVRVGHVTARLVPRLGVDLGDVEVGRPAFLTLARVQVTAEWLPLLSGRIEGASLRVADTTLSLPLPRELPFPPGPRSGQDQASAGSAPPVTIVSVHTIELDDVLIKSLGRSIRLSAVAGLEADRLALTRLTATAGRTALTAKGQIALAPRVDARLEASASALDLDDLLALVHAFRLDGAAAPGSSGPPPMLALQLDAPVVRVAGLEASALQAGIRTDGTRLLVDPVSLTLFDGQARGALRLRLASRVTGEVSLSVRGLDTARLATWVGAPGAVSGRLTGSGTFSGSGVDLGTLLATARGTGRVTIADGALKGLEFPREALLALGRPADQAPPPNGGRFDQIAASFRVGNGRLASDDLTLTSRDVSVSATGSLELGTHALEAQGTATLSEAMTALAGPALARLAGGEPRIALPARVGGTLEAPRLRLDAGAMLKRTLKNEVKRSVLDRLTPLRDLARPKAQGTF